MLSPLLQTLPFVHPVLAAAALATGLIPIVVHLINRRRYHRVVWAAMSFLLAAHERSVKRLRFEHWLLMLARVAVIVLLGLAIARPYLPTSPLIPGPSGRAHRILLVDNSLSMNAHDAEGWTRFDLARQGVRGLLTSFPQTDTISVVTLADPAEAIIAHAAHDRRIIRDRLADIEPTQRMADTVGAVERTMEILRSSEAPPENRTVYLISDFRRGEWEGSTATLPTPTVVATRRLADMLADSGIDLNLMLVGSDFPDNVAVTRFDAESLLVSTHLPVRFSVRVVNFGARPARDLILQIRRNGQVVRREPLPMIDPGESAVTSNSLAFSTAGTHALEARVITSNPDALDDDNARYLSIEVRESIPVLLVDGRPGTTLLAGEAGFLATALAPKVSAAFPDEVGLRSDRLDEPSPMDVKTISPPELEAEALPEYDVVVLCDVPRLSASEWGHLKRFVSRGGGLFIFSGDLLDPGNYNRFGYADGGGLLPGRIGHPATEAEGTDAYTGFDADELTHPIVAEFAGRSGSGLFLARVDRYLGIEPDAQRAEVVLRYTNGDYALVSSTFGQGRVLFCTTTADMTWNNLPAKGDYVSLMFNAVASLSPRHGDHRNIPVGGTINEPLTPGQASLPLRVTTGAGATKDARVVSTGDALACAYGPVERAGTLSVSIGSDIRSYAVNLDPRGSDISGLDEEALLRILDRPARVTRDLEGVAQAVSPGRSAELATAALLVVMVLLFGEMWLAMRFGSHGAPTPGVERGERS